MAKIHELIAVEKDVKGTVNKVSSETRKTFTSRQDHFEEHSKEYQALKDDDHELLDNEFKAMVTTVPEKLAYFEHHMQRMFDIIIQKELSNASATADIILTKDDGTKVVLFVNAPVAAIVQMGNLMESIRTQVYDVIPTLDPKKQWTPEGNRDDVYVTPDIRRTRTKKVQVPIELSPATDRHPAQVQLVTEDVTTGHWVQKYWSGAISSADKSRILKRTDEIIAALKKAKTRANDADVVESHIGARLMQYIQTGE